jgi:hypothetical protein
MIPYIPHVTVIIAVCFLFYKIFLQKETFYRLNRWTLMACLAVAFALPLLPAPRQWSWRDNYENSLSGLFETTPLAKTVVPLRQESPSAILPYSAALPSSSILPPVATTRQQGPMQPSSSLRSVTLTQSDLRIPYSSHKQHASHRKTTSFTPEISPGKSVPAASAITPVLLSSPSSDLSPRKAASFFPQLIHWLFYCYWFGVIIFGLNFLLQIVILLYQSYKSPVIRDGRYRIVETGGNRAPCSFGNNIFINPSIYDWETYNQILIHEKIHVSGRHTIDILLAEIVVILQWFNPFAWLYRKEVENNLEFLTDHSVLLHQEVERSAYQLSLLRVSAPHLPFSITTNYNQSLLKRRIVMMNSKHSSLHTIWKYFFLIPVLTLLVCALNKPVAFGQSADSGKKDLSGKRNDTSVHRTTKDTIRPDPGNEAPLTRVRVESAGSHTLNVPDQDVTATDVEPLVVTLKNVNVGSRGYGSQVYVNALVGADSHGDDGIMPVTVNARVGNLNTMYTTSGYAAMAVNVGDDETEGSWFVTSSEDKMNFELKGESEEHSWSNSFTVAKSEFNPFPGQGTVEFKLVREAGTIVFKGQFDGQEGFGHYKFKADDSYIAYLKQKGVEDLEERRVFSFFVANVTKDFTNMILHNGYPHISGRYLIAMSRMHIDEAYLKSWKQSGYGDLSEQDLITAKSMHVDPAYAQEMKTAGYDNLSLRELIRLKSQRIDGDYVRSLHTASGSALPPAQDLIAYKSMRIDSGYLASLQKIGYTGLSYREIISLHNMHVTADYIKGFLALGYKDLPARSLISLKSRDITPDFIKGFKDAGYSDIELQDLSSLKAVGITPDFIKEFKNIGYDHIPIRELRTLKVTGVDAAYVAKMKEKGFVSNDLDKYIRLKHAFE